MPRKRICMVLGCETEYKHKFKFPSTSDQRLPIWLAASGNAALLNVPPQKLAYATMCGRHFEQKYMLAKHLVYTAVPTLHLPPPIDGSKYLEIWHDQILASVKKIHKNVKLVQNVDYSGSTVHLVSTGTTIATPKSSTQTEKEKVTAIKDEQRKTIIAVEIKKNETEDNQNNRTAKATTFGIDVQNAESDEAIQGSEALETTQKKDFKCEMRNATETSTAAQLQISTSTNDKTLMTSSINSIPIKLWVKKAVVAKSVQEYRAHKFVTNVSTVTIDTPTSQERGMKRSANVHENNVNVPKRRISDSVVPDYVDEQFPLAIPIISSTENDIVIQQELSTIHYKDYLQHLSAHNQFKMRFLDINFGAVCFTCDRIWYENDLKLAPESSRQVLTSEFPDFNFEVDRVCNTCYASLKKEKIPNLSKSNGFAYPMLPEHLPELDLISERFISPRLPFMQIRRLRYGQGQYDMLGQIINVPISINNMVYQLPRDFDDDFCMNVHIKNKKIHRSSYLMAFVKKRAIKSWLQYLINTPLYRLYDITIKSSFLSDDQKPHQPIVLHEYCEEIDIKESLIAQQQTLLWNEDRYLCLAPGEYNVPQSIFFDEHCEELSFPSIYLGQFRTFKNGLNVTPFMMVTSELRRADRRGVHPTHLLYMVMKIMRLRIQDSLTSALKFIEGDTKLTRAQVESHNFINGYIETNLAFLRSIPNSTYYWAQRKRDLFAMIRQLGKPTFFLTMSANEIGWPKLIKTLYKLKNNGTEISDYELRHLHYNDKAKLINEDPVTCAIYFNKLVDTIINILQSKQISPFGNHYVTHFFKRIEFQHQGSPHAHILLWLNDAPTNPLTTENSMAIEIIDRFVSVSESDSSGYAKLQCHKHTFICDKKNSSVATTICRFGAPFMPCPSTVILTPMSTTDSRRSAYGRIYTQMWKALEENDYTDIDHFFREHNINSIEFYLDVLRAGITYPKVFLKRQPSEKWINPFNPFILNVLGSNMNMQFIIEEYSCASYVAEYVNNTNRGISNLQQKIIEIIEEHSEFNVEEITRKLSVDLLNTVEITTQEAAWYLLDQPMSQSSDVVIYIPTTWPTERERIENANKQLEEDESTHIVKNNWFEKYQRRPEMLENLTLAQVVANFIVIKKTWIKCQSPRIIRYRNYDIDADLNEYKREMVTLHFPFRNEETEILQEMRFIQLYDENEVLILQRKREFESDFDIAKTMQICHQLYTEENEDADAYMAEDMARLFATHIRDPDVFTAFITDRNADTNVDLRLFTSNKLNHIVKISENAIDKEKFNKLMHSKNYRHKALLLHVIAHILDKKTEKSQQISFTGPAGWYKTF